MQFTTKEYSFRGHVYKIACLESFDTHPSWFTYEDESDVRNDKWLIEPGDCVFDVGAAYGSYSLTALSAGADKVFAWAPQGTPGEATEAELCRASIQLNGWQDKAEIFTCGVYDRDGWIDTYTQEFFTSEPASNPAVIPVQKMNTWYRDYFLKNYKKDQYKRYWLKLDVEGAELEVLRSASALIQDLKPCIMIENHNFKRATIEQEVRDFVNSFGWYKEISTTPYHSVSHSLYLPV